MKPTRKILTRSLSAMSDAVVSGTMGLVGSRRKSNTKRDSSDDGDSGFMDRDEEGDPAAFLPVESDEPTVACPSNYDASPGSRQGGYFDGFDFGIPLVEEPVADSDTLGDSFEDIAQVLPDLLADSPTPSDETPSTPGSALTVRLKKWKSRISSTLRSSASKPSTPENSPSSDSSLTSLPQVEEEIPQLARLSFASDVTTGTLARYLAKRQAYSKDIEHSLGRAVGMSILAYEREGSWLVEHGHVGEAGNPNFVCPFPQCDAHNGTGCRGSILSYGWHQQLPPHIETVAED